jgi:uncharacterized protein YjiK
MHSRIFALAGVIAFVLPSLASALSLSDYSVTGTFALPALAPEASAVTYNWDSGTLFVLGDEGDAVVEVDAAGTQITTMALTGFDDTEGLTYVGGGQFVVTEERLRDAYLLPYAAGGSAARSSLQSADLGATVGNVGIEGISFDRRDGSYVFVKEKTPQEVNLATITFASATASTSSLFTPSLGVTDLSDVQVLSDVASLVGTPGEDDLLIYSQESTSLLHVTRTGVILGSFDFGAYSLEAEGVTIDQNGTIYIVSESSLPSGGSTLFVLTAVPEPGSLALVALGATILGARRRGQAA